MIAGILKPHSILKVSSPKKKATKPATTNPGNNPKEPMTSKNLFLAAIHLKGLEKVVITQRIIATVIETGCKRYASKSSKNTW